MYRPHIVRIGLVFALLAALVIVPVSAAQPNASAQVGKHCVVNIEPVRPGQSVSVMSNLQCFSNFREAITLATGGAVKVSSPTQLTQAMLSSGVNAMYVLGIDFPHPNYQGNSLIWTSSLNCEMGLTFFANSMPAGWNDIVSSTRAFSGCNQNFSFEHLNQSGASIVCFPDCAYVGNAMNDRTSSKRWTS